jgi:hypothetical protein
MRVKMASDGALPNEEFEIDYPGVGPHSFLSLWYDKGAEGQERLRLAHQVIQQQNSEDALASKAINVREGCDATADEGGVAGRVASLVWDNLSVTSTTTENVLNSNDDIVGTISVKNVACAVKSCSWTGKLKGGSTGAAVLHFKRVAGKKQQTENVIAHQKAVRDLAGASANTFVTPSGKIGTYMSFEESFENAVNYTYVVVEGLMSGNSSRHQRVKTLVSGYNERARPPCPATVSRISGVIHELMKQKQTDRIKRFSQESGGQNCFSTQFDGWSDGGVSYFGCNICYVEVTDDSVFLVDQVLDFREFPYESHNGDNIKTWYEDLMKENGITIEMVSQVTIDGASNGQAALAKIPGLLGKITTCHAHQLQRGILTASGGGCASFAASKNQGLQRLIKKHKRIAQFFNQSHKSNGFLAEEQVLSGVKKESTLTTITTSETRWSGIHSQISRSNIIAPYIDLVARSRLQDAKVLSGMTCVCDEDPGMSVIKDMTTRDLCLTRKQWEISAEFEYAMKPAAEATKLIETSSKVDRTGRSLTPDQAIFKVYDVKIAAGKDTQWVPGPREIGPSRSRTLYEVKSDSMSIEVQTFKAILAEELDERIFKNTDQPIAASHLVMLAMSKQGRKANQGYRDLLGKENAIEADLAYTRALNKVYAEELWGYKKNARSGTSSGKKRKLMGDSDEDEVVEVNEVGASSGSRKEGNAVMLEMEAWDR